MRLVWCHRCWAFPLLQSKTTINAVAWLPGGRRVYSGAQTGEVTIWGGTTLTFESSMQVLCHL